MQGCCLLLSKKIKKEMKKFFFIFLVIQVVFQAEVGAQNAKEWTLGDCISYALERNIQVLKSGLSNERNEVNALQAKAQKLMSVNASIGNNFNWSKSTSSGSSALSSTFGSSYSLNSGITVFNGLRLNNQVKQAELGIESGIYSLETIKESVSLSILNAYLQILYAEEQVKNSLNQIKATEEELALAEERLLLKVISQADYAQVKSQLASEKLTLANAESQLAITRVNLMQLMELPVTDSFKIAVPVITEPLNSNLIPDVKSIYETALSVKPQIKNAEVNKQISALDEKIARAGYYPVLSVSAGVSSSYSDVLTDSYFSQLNDGIRPSAGFSISIPIYQKNQVKSSVDLAKISYRDAELTEINTRNELRKSIEQACQDVISSQAEYEASLESYNAAAESGILSEEKFRQGLINSVDYLVSKTNLIAAESKLLQSKYKLIFSYKVLDFYNGVPLSL
ncbi:MAG TPA: hypothetical protein DFI01_07330 [Bacteroidales bacterium]|nr:hypothetical protein [Bacteroidales bacterium]